MKLRSTLLLLLACAGLGGYLYFIENKQSTTDEILEQGNRIFQGLKTEEIQKFKLEHPGVKITCQRKTDVSEEWQITEPLTAKADRYVIDQILSKLEFLEKSRVLEKAPPGEYGLQEPQTKITFWTKNNSHLLAIGNKTAVGNQTYARVDQRDSIFVVSEEVESILKKQVADLRDRKLLMADVHQVQQFTMKDPSRTLTCKKQEKEGWEIVGQVSYQGDKNKIEEFLRDWLHLQASEFVQENSENLAVLGLDPPSTEISVWIEGQTEPQKLLLGNSPPGRSEIHAKLANQQNVVLVSSEANQWLKKEILELRDKHLFRGDKEKLSRLEWTQDGKSWQFEKKENTWKTILPEGKTVSENRIKSAIDQLGEVTFLRLVGDKQESECFPAQGVMELKVWMEGGLEPSLILKIGSKFPDLPQYYAKNKDSQEIYGVSAGSVGVFLALTVEESQ